MRVSLRDKIKYYYNLILVFSITIVATVLYIWDYNLLVRIFTYPILFLRVYHLVWFYAVTYIAKMMYPPFCQNVANCKMFRKYYEKRRTKNQDKILKKDIEKSNSGAAMVGLLWLFLFIIGSVMRVGDFLGEAGVVMVVLYIGLFDIICLYFWCPFKYVLETRCCNTCRISQWAPIMTMLPLLYIPSFWSYSLVLLSLGAFIQFEYFHIKFPERFYEVSNRNLDCNYCPEEFCRMNKDKYPKLKEDSIFRHDGKKY